MGRSSLAAVVRAMVGARTRFMLTVVNTAWLYPLVDIEAALASTSVSHTYTGDQIVATNTSELSQIAEDIYNATVSGAYPGGYSLRTGLLVEDLGRVLTFQLDNGNTFLLWRLVRLITDQTGMPSAGDAPAGLVGFIPTFVAAGNVVGAQFDPVRVVRIG